MAWYHEELARRAIQKLLAGRLARWALGAILGGFPQFLDAVWSAIHDFSMAITPCNTS